ncbi:hypothetical protein DFQ29_001007 [Apophysomyces sp. BC1021]|nr:hypothetical protein DFQ29_001007 [Apophysomyces sp. BC1021]
MSHHCHDEHCDHDHDDLPGAGDQFLLYSRIAHDNVRCLNELEPDSGTKIIRPWNERMENTKASANNGCNGLLNVFFLYQSTLKAMPMNSSLSMYRTFTGTVKLRSICLRTDRGDAAPSSMKVFINRDDVDFDVVESYSPIQTWDLVQGSDEVIEYGTRVAKYTNVRNITLFFPENFGEDTSIIRFLGFKGEWTEIKKDPIITVYEASANPADHKTPAARPAAIATDAEPIVWLAAEVGLELGWPEVVEPRAAEEARVLAEAEPAVAELEIVVGAMFEGEAATDDEAAMEEEEAATVLLEPVAVFVVVVVTAMVVVAAVAVAAAVELPEVGWFAPAAGSGTYGIDSAKLHPHNITPTQGFFMQTQKGLPSSKLSQIYFELAQYQTHRLLHIRDRQRDEGLGST